MTTRKRFAGGVPQATLAADITNSATSFDISDFTGWPTTFPYDCIINKTSTTTRERITVGGHAGNTLNSITRGIDGTSAQAHSINDTIELCVTGTWHDEIGAILGGATGSIPYGGSTITNLAIGTAQQGLSVNAGATAPQWSFNGVVPIFASTAARDTAIPSPTSGQAAYVDTGTSAEGLYFYNGTSWRPAAWNTPWGVVASASSTSNQTGITALADITFATVTWTAVSNRLYRITLAARLAQQTSNGVITVALQTGASGAGTEIFAHNSGGVATVAGNIAVANLVTYQTGSGSISAHVRVATTAGTVDVGNATDKGWFVVEDIGPTGAPA